VCGLRTRYALGPAAACICPVLQLKLYTFLGFCFDSITDSEKREKKEDTLRVTLVA